MSLRYAKYAAKILQVIVIAKNVKNAEKLEILNTSRMEGRDANY